MNIDKNSKGFVLVTTLVLLGMLGMLGASAAWKTSVESKVSKLSGNASQALAVASAGIEKQFYEWALDATTGSPDGDRAELVSLIRFIQNGTGTPPSIYIPAAAVGGIDELRTFIDSVAAGQDIDGYIVAGASGIRTYALTNAGIQILPAANWGQDPSVPQVAVWATSFVDSGNAQRYPYQTPNTSAQCDNCSIVLYALGAHEGVYSLVRQKVSTVSNLLNGVSAMTNAPAGGNYAEICAGGGNTSASSNVTPWDPTVTGPGGNKSAVLEVTQATYKLGRTPSGNAIISNTVLGTGGKGFRKGPASQTGASFASTPYLVYSGHGTATGVKADWADMKHDTTGVDLPPGLLPQNLIAAPLLGGDTEIQFFTKPEEQLFSMPAYRWAAEQFTCQNNAWPPAPNPANDGRNGNGIYCSKGERLRVALRNMGYTPRAPVTGRLSLAEFQYNIANNIPMFGMVRVMFPAQQSGKAGACGDLHIIEQPANAPNGENFNKLRSTAGGVYEGAALGSGGTASVVLDMDGDLGPTARLIVYGSLLVDYFADYDIRGFGGAAAAAATGNAVFDAAGGERFLKPTESPDVYLAIEHNIMINPTMPRFGVGGEPQAFPTAAPVAGVPGPSATPSRLNNNTALNATARRGLARAGRINMMDLNRAGDPAILNGSLVHLASPYDGIFPWAEGLVPRAAGVSNVGTMRLMSRGTSGLVGAVQQMQAAGAAQPVGIPTAKMVTLLTQPKPRRVTPPLTLGGTESDVLQYYYNLMTRTVVDPRPGNTPDKQSWPIANWPGGILGGDFYMGEEDEKNGNNDGDKLHLMFPSGYAHGWKVALAALDVSADEWNNIFTGGQLFPGIGQPGGLYAQFMANCGGVCAKGWPMSRAEPEFATAADVIVVEGEESDYFYITPDVNTGYGLLDGAWKDIPATMYSGGLLDMHAHSNMNGIIYTPGPLEWEPGNSNYDNGKTLGHLSYVTGAIITGFGQYTKNNKPVHRYVLVFDKQSVDNVTANTITVILRKHAWQELR